MRKITEKELIEIGMRKGDINAFYDNYYKYNYNHDNPETAPAMEIRITKDNKWLYLDMSVVQLGFNSDIYLHDIREEEIIIPDFSERDWVEFCTQEGVPGLCTNGGEYYFYTRYDRVGEDNWKVSYRTSSEFAYNPTNGRFGDYNLNDYEFEIASTERLIEDFKKYPLS